MRRFGDPVTRVLAALGESGTLDYAGLRMHTGLDGLVVVQALESLERDGRVQTDREGKETMWSRTSPQDLSVGLFEGI